MDINFDIGLCLILTAGLPLPPDKIRKYGDLPQQLITVEEIKERADFRRIGIAVPRARRRGGRGQSVEARGRGGRGQGAREHGGGRARGRGVRGTRGRGLGRGEGHGRGRAAQAVGFIDLEDGYK